ncbi:MAG: SCO1664 family protein [bacterium]
MAGAELTAPLALVDEDALELLVHGRITVEGQVVDASNATLYVGIEHEGVRAAAAYKPVAGERPLWDFPDGTLAGREVAAYCVSAMTGWDVVPPTVLRDGPFGPGMVQLWIDSATVDLRSLLRSSDERLRRIAVLDAVINNGDRKGGHLLPTANGHIYGIDHGVAFNVDDKLRTVIWNWAGEALCAQESAMLAELRGCLDGSLGTQLAEHLTRAEVRRTRSRVDRLLRFERFPLPSSQWPPVPWPAM